MRVFVFAAAKNYRTGKKIEENIILHSAVATNIVCLTDCK